SSTRHWPSARSIRHPGCCAAVPARSSADWWRAGSACADGDETMNTNTTASPLTLFDPMVDDAANRLFGKLGPPARLAADRGEPGESLRDAVAEAGFCEALGSLDAGDDWPAAAAILRAQARPGAPVDMAAERLATALGGEPDDAASANAPDGRRRRGMALARCIQSGGAMQAALDLSIRYVGDRKQFGQALARFQAIQHSLAVTA